MPYSIRTSRIFLALLFSVAALCASVLAPKPAEASWSNYCNPKTVSGWQACNGSPRYTHQVYGWGDQHSVCVWVAAAVNSTKRCSSGPGAGVYSPVFSEFLTYPYISNNAAGTNTLHGISFTA
jgi:hypothetical protein